MTTLSKLVTPFETLSSQQKLWSTVGVVILVFAIWTSSGSAYIPNPHDVIGAFPTLIQDKDVFWHFQKSLFFCFEAILYSASIALFIAFLSVIPMFTRFCEFLRKFRFLPSTGLSFFFMKISGNIEQQMSWMMIFGVTTWLIDSMVGIALDISDDDKLYARSLRLGRWEMMKELLIFGKAADMFKAVIANFAIAWLLLASIENIAKAQGGIGVVLAESNKYFKMEEVYAVQFLILFTGIMIDASLRWMRSIFFPYTSLKH